MARSVQIIIDTYNWEKDPFNQIFTPLFFQSADEFIQVHFLETSDDHGILDPDDVLSDVVDDKDKVLIIPNFEISNFMSKSLFFLHI